MQVSKTGQRCSIRVGTNRDEGAQVAVLDVGGEVERGNTHVGGGETIGSRESGRLGVKQDHITGMFGQYTFMEDEQMCTNR